jgi:hypothetical protein
MRALIILGAFLLTGCAVGPVTPPTPSLEVRSMQSREFNGQDPRLVMKAVLNVLQDEGFVTKNAVTDLGLITATREIDARNSFTMAFGTLMMGEDASWHSSDIIEATANVSEIGGRVRVRVSFQEKSIDNHGTLLGINTIEDPIYYQSFFAKVDRGLFVERQGV